MSHGWISIHREITQHWIFQDAGRFRAWIDMLLRAGYMEKKIFFNGDLIDLELGQFVCSQVKISKDWGWSRAKTKRFLNVLETEQMIVQQTDNHKTLITICNYYKWQTEKRECNTANVTADVTAEKQQKSSRRSTNNKDKKDNKEKEDLYAGLSAQQGTNLKYWLLNKKGKLKPVGIKALITRLDKGTAGNNSNVGWHNLREAAENSLSNNYQGLIAPNCNKTPNRKLTTFELNPDIVEEIKDDLRRKTKDDPPVASVCIPRME